mmetsp:Transcript_24531/g.36103  ORF Transcript_24531/g.36103 Transcript_24531/m.36103 type:complete len:675 (-) Transcript_24531:199-2223(-)
MNLRGSTLIDFFSILSLDSPLDHYLAGYFEKILEMLFRRMTVPVMAYLNKGGMPLLRKFLTHIDNYSMMQIVQRIMLPHIPFSNEDMESLSLEERRSYQCDWSYQEETCDMLFERMLEKQSPDVPSHISDLLITVLQLSPHESLFLTNLRDSKYLPEMLSYVAMEHSEPTSYTDQPTVELSISLASMSVLESLVSRLCESLNPFEFGGAQQGEEGADAEGRTSALIAESVEKISRAFIPVVPQIAEQLRAHCAGTTPSSSPICGTFDAQCNQTFTRLGPRGLHLVKLVEAVVRLANDDVDEALCSSGAFRACIDLMFAYPLNSLLHLSVQRIVLILIEGGATDRTLKHLLSDCGLVEHVMEVVGEESGTKDGDRTDGDGNGRSPRQLIAGSRRPIVGHVITIAQTLSAVLRAEEDSVLAMSMENDGQDKTKSALHTTQDSEKIPSGASVLRRVMEECNIAEQWDAFESKELRALIEKQTVFAAVDVTPDSSPKVQSPSQMDVALEALALNDRSAWANTKVDEIDPTTPDDEELEHTADRLVHAMDNQASGDQFSGSSSSDDDSDEEDNTAEQGIGEQFNAFENSDFAFPSKGSDMVNTFDAAFADFESATTAPFEASFDSSGPAEVFADFSTSGFDSKSTEAASTGDTFDPFGTASAVDVFADAESTAPKNEDG